MKPQWVLEYESLEVTSLLAPMVTSVTYTDHSHGKSDELELTVHDVDALWRTGWWPAKSDRLRMQIGYEGEALVPCGDFQVDDVTTEGPPDTVKIHALSAGHAAKLRTKQTRAFEGLTLEAVAEQIAAENGMTVVGSFESELVTAEPVERITQDDETTLAFLARLAEENGYEFNVRGDLLCFQLLSELEAQLPVFTFGLGDLKRYNFSSTVQHTYIACEVSFFDPRTGRPLTARVYEQNFRVRGDEEVEPPPVEVPPNIAYDPPGDNRDDDLVGEWQRFLQTQGTGPNGLYDYRIDNWYLDITAAGTAKFQEQNGVPVNGKEVGPETWRAAIALGFRGGAPQGPDPLGDVLYAEVRVESIEQAERKAAALLHRANRLAVSGSIEVVGNPLLLAGSKVGLQGLFRLDGGYKVEKSRHSLVKSGGYKTEANLVYVP